LVSFLSVGSCVVHPNQAGGNAYLRGPTATQTVPVGKAAQTITFTTTPATAPLIGDSYPVAATGGGSGQAVTFTSGSPAVCTVNVATVTFVAAGTCVINANQTGTTTYTPAPQASQIITVTMVAPPPSSSTPPPSRPSRTPSGGQLASAGIPAAALTLLAFLLVLAGGLLLLLGWVCGAEVVGHELDSRCE
jgi:hypothetical protein